MTLPNFMVIGLQNKEITQGGGIRPPPSPPAVLDSKKPGLFRVNIIWCSVHIERVAFVLQDI